MEPVFVRDMTPLCRRLNLDPGTVTGIQINLLAREFATVTVTMAVDKSIVDLLRVEENLTN